jgi:hypothetical protein
MFELFACPHRACFHRDPVHLHEPPTLDHILLGPTNTITGLLLLDTSLLHALIFW